MNRPFRLTYAVVTVLAIVTGCKAQDIPKQDENFAYWTSKPGMKCAKMGGNDYCVPIEQIRAENFTTDSAPGFLVQMPVDSPELKDCNKQRYSLDTDPFPAIQLFFSDRYSKKDNDTTKKYYERMFEDRINANGSGSWVIPKQISSYYGMNCIQYKRNSYLKEEMLCYGGRYGGPNPPFFLSCDWDGSVPYPGCNYTLFVDGIEVKASFRKPCVVHHAEISRLMLNYLRNLRVGKD